MLHKNSVSGLACDLTYNNRRVRSRPAVEANQIVLETLGMNQPIPTHIANQIVIETLGVTAPMYVESGYVESGYVE